MLNGPVLLGVALVSVGLLILVPLSGPAKLGLVLAAIFLASLAGVRRR
jgi:hypothetical protein